MIASSITEWVICGACRRRSRPSGIAPRSPADPDVVRQAPKVILPGVGAFADAAAELRRTGLGEAFCEAVRAGKPCLGVCLGFSSSSTSARRTASTRAWACSPAGSSGSRSAPGLKIPHMGWNTLRIKRPAPIFAGLGPEPSVYFVHSYHAVADRPEDVAAEADHPDPFPACLARKPDGLPVPPREEPAGRPGDVCELRGAVRRRGSLVQ